MRYLKKLLKLFMEDKLLVLGIIVSLALVRLLVVLHIPSAMAGLLFVLFLMASMFLSLRKEKKRRGEQNASA